MISQASLIKNEWHIEYHHELNRYIVTKEPHMFIFELRDGKYRCILQDESNNINRIHQALGHPGVNSTLHIKRLMADMFKNITDEKIKSFKCEHCQRGKFTRQPHTQVPTVENIGDLVHIDTLEIGQKIYLIATDNKSKYIMCELLKDKKRETYNKALTKMRTAYRIYGHDIKSISSDCDPSFQPLDNMLHHRVEPGNHEAVAERSNRSIQERVRVILDSLPYTLPKRYMAYVIPHVAQCINLRCQESFTHYPIHKNLINYSFGDIMLFKISDQEKHQPRACYGLILARALDGLLTVLNIETGIIIQRRYGTRINKEINWDSIQDTLMNRVKYKQYTPVIHLATTPERARFEEIQQLVDKQVITPLELNENITVLPTKMIIKPKGDHWKGRLVARGDLQSDNEEYDGPTIHTSSILILLCICTSQNHHVTVMDVNGAYLNAQINDEIGIKLSKKDSTILKSIDSKFVPNKEGKITVKLAKALYGLKQSALLWYKTIKNTLIDHCHLSVSSYDPCLFFSENVLLGLYVDDMIITYKEERQYNAIVEVLEKHFNVLKKTHLTKDNKISFRGLNISTHEKGLKIDQSEYAKIQIVDAFNKSLMLKPTIDVDHIQTMINENINIASDKYLNTKESITMSADEQKLFVQITNRIGWLSSQTRMDLKFPFSILSSKCLHPSYEDMKLLKHTVQYIEKTTHIGLKTYTGEQILHGYADASYAIHQDNRASHTGVVIFLSNTPVVSVSKKQNLIALSSHEAELYAAHHAIKLIMGLKEMLKEINNNMVIHSPTTLFQDNQGTIKSLMRESINKKSKHIQIRFHHMKQAIEQDNIKLQYINTELMIADIHTKALPNTTFNKLRSLLMEQHEIPQITDLTLDTKDKRAEELGIQLEEEPHPTI